MKILITGANGFIGRNLTAALEAAGTHTLYRYDVDTPQDALDGFCRDCEFVFHLAGVNRPKEKDAFMEGNFGFTGTLLDTLRAHGNRCPVMLSSSTQAVLNNPYGESKRAGEELLFAYGREMRAPVYVFRFTNVFGKWSRPNYNSAVATFCYNIARDLPVTVNDPATVMRLVYIDDVVNALLRLLDGNVERDGAYCTAEPTHEATLGHIVSLLHSFRESRETLAVPDMTDPFTKKLYATYLSFLPMDDFSYPLNMHVDPRGSFTEFLRTPDRGQVSVNVAKPGITKGNHWHHTKNEKFLVVSGRGVIRFRSPDGGEIVEYHVTGDKLTVVDIPTGYTHSIANEGDTDLITIMWVNEPFDPGHPDTYYLEV